jgi:hypothetical protein
MRRREIDPARSFWRVVVTPDKGADLNYIGDRIANLAGVNTVMIEERRITTLWHEGENDGGGGGGGGSA